MQAGSQATCPSWSLCAPTRRDMPRSDDGEVEEGELDGTSASKWEAPTPDAHPAPAAARSRAGKRFRTWDPREEDLPAGGASSGQPEGPPKDSPAVGSVHPSDERSAADPYYDGRDSLNRYDDRRTSDRRYESYPPDADARCVAFRSPPLGTRATSHRTS